ncbi:MAG: alpha/beta hydrolase-fold protein [Propionibacteriaceae bacterium]|nr:alpha/beta hydrolase-fold protein [Propionibacteriaceae bacterium]
MRIEYVKRYSSPMGRDMEYKVYGYGGVPLVAFPTMRGRFWQWEDFGMVETLSDLIDAGTIRLWTADSIDDETFCTDSWDKLAAMRRQEQYLAYLGDELLPEVSRMSGGQHVVLTGCSMGAFHAANLFFRRPWDVRAVIAMSGVYSTRYFFGDYLPPEVVANSPLDGLPGLNDAGLLDHYRSSDLIFCAGQGAYEDRMAADTRALGEVLQRLDVPAWIDLWGRDVNHDWPWWKKQLPYFLGHVL